MASSMDRSGELRLPADGSQALFVLAGMSDAKLLNNCCDITLLP